MYNLVNFVLCFYIFGNFIEISTACNGYEFKLLSYKECSDNNIIKLINPNTKIDDACNVIPEGCLKTEGFNSATVQYKIEKKPLPAFEGEIDLCKGLETKSQEVSLVLSMLNLPDSCPVQKFEICADGNKKVSIEKFKSKLPLAAGIISANLTIKHDVGETCMSVEGEIKKK